MNEMQEREFFDFVMNYSARTPELRDQFAIAALPSIIEKQRKGRDLNQFTKIAAQQAYAYADAMMTEKDKP